MMAVVGLLSFNFTVVLPAVARFTFGGSATTYALMVNFLAVGALGGALRLRRAHERRRSGWSPGRRSPSGGARRRPPSSTTLPSFLVAMIAVGAASVTVLGFGAVRRCSSPPRPRCEGGSCSLYQLVYMGTTPLGALVVGALASTVGPRSGLVLGAAGALVAGAVGIWVQRRSSDPSTSGRPEPILSSGATAPARR